MKIPDRLNGIKVGDRLTYRPFGELKLEPDITYGWTGLMSATLDQNRVFLVTGEVMHRIGEQVNGLSYTNSVFTDGIFNISLDMLRFAKSLEDYKFLVENGKIIRSATITERVCPGKVLEFPEKFTLPRNVFLSHLKMLSTVRKIEAIKFYRLITGAGLVEAKEFIESRVLAEYSRFDDPTYYE